jgi:hypothetical protein
MQAETANYDSDVRSFDGDLAGTRKALVFVLDAVPELFMTPVEVPGGWDEARGIRMESFRRWSTFHVV